MATTPPARSPRFAQVRGLLRHPRRLLAGVVFLLVLAVGLGWLGRHLPTWRHLHAARSAWEQYHTPQAIPHVQACLKAWPEDAEVLLLAARVARRTGRFQEATVGLEKYRRRRGDDAAHKLEQTLLFAERGEMDRVHDRCRRWIETNHPDTVLILEALAHGYVRSFRCAEALACLREWQTRQPDNPQALWLEGQVYGLQHDFRAAVRSYQRAIACDPQHEEVRLALVNALMEDKDYAAALPHVDSLHQRQPDNLHLQVRLAECHDGLGQPSEADRLLETVLARQPSFAPALALRGKIALRNGQLETAENCLREAITLLPGAYELRYQLMRCLDQRGKTTEAREQERLFQQLQADKRRFNEIVGREMARSPHDPALQCELGLILLRAGLTEDGVRWLKSALAREPGFADAHAALADYYERNGKREQAASHRRLASMEVKQQ